MEIVNRNAVAAFTTKDTSIIRELLAPRNSSTERQSLAEATLAPGAETQAHSHPATEELYYVLEGIALMAIETEQRSVGPGDAIVIPPGRRHQIRNTGEGPLVFLCCCVPAYSDQDTVMCPSLLEGESGSRTGAMAKESRHGRGGAALSISDSISDMIGRSCEIPGQ